MLELTPEEEDQLLYGPYCLSDSPEGLEFRRYMAEQTGLLSPTPTAPSHGEEGHVERKL
jgi:hypothetical protein